MAFRGTDWMQEPCRSCARRDIDSAAAAASVRAHRQLRARPIRSVILAPNHAVVARLRRCQEDAPYAYRPDVTGRGVCAAKPRHAGRIPMHAEAKVGDYGQGKPAGPDFPHPGRNVMIRRVSAGPLLAGTLCLLATAAYAQQQMAPRLLRHRHPPQRQCSRRLWRGCACTGSGSGSRCARRRTGCRRAGRPARR